MDRRVYATTARTRLNRGSYYRDRVSLGEGRNERFAQIAADFPVGDIMLAQKIALETDEHATLAVANRCR
jgi:hypothetical protein